MVKLKTIKVQAGFAEPPVAGYIKNGHLVNIQVLLEDKWYYHLRNQLIATKQLFLGLIPPEDLETVAQAVKEKEQKEEVVPKKKERKVVEVEQLSDEMSYEQLD